MVSSRRETRSIQMAQGGSRFVRWRPFDENATFELTTARVSKRLPNAPVSGPEESGRNYHWIMPLVGSLSDATSCMTILSMVLSQPVSTEVVTRYPKYRMPWFAP